MNKQGEGVKHLEVLESETGGCVAVVGMTDNDWRSLQVEWGGNRYGQTLTTTAVLKFLILEALLKGVKHP